MTIQVFYNFKNFLEFSQARTILMIFIYLFICVIETNYSWKCSYYGDVNVGSEDYFNHLRELINLREWKNTLIAPEDYYRNILIVISGCISHVVNLICKK